MLLINNRIIFARSITAAWCNFLSNYCLISATICHNDLLSVSHQREREREREGTHHSLLYFVINGHSAWSTTKKKKDLLTFCSTFLYIYPVINFLIWNNIKLSMVLSAMTVVMGSLWQGIPYLGSEIPPKMHIIISSFAYHTASFFSQLIVRVFIKHCFFFYLLVANMLFFFLIYQYIIRLNQIKFLWYSKKFHKNWLMFFFLKIVKKNNNYTLEAHEELQDGAHLP